MNESFKYDVRVRERLLARGVLSAEALERALSGLPDREDHAVPVAVTQPSLGAGPVVGAVATAYSARDGGDDEDDEDGA